MGGDGITMCEDLRLQTKDLQKSICLILHGGTPKDEQDFAINSEKYKTHPNGPYERKIVMSTNVAESSLTVEGIVYVVDCGLEYSDSYEPLRMCRSLQQGWISKSAVKQRKG